MITMNIFIIYPCSEEEYNDYETKLAKNVNSHLSLFFNLINNNIIIGRYILKYLSKSLKNDSYNLNYKVIKITNKKNNLKDDKIVKIMNNSDLILLFNFMDNPEFTKGYVKDVKEYLTKRFKLKYQLVKLNSRSMDLLVPLCAVK